VVLKESLFSSLPQCPCSKIGRDRGWGGTAVVASRFARRPTMAAAAVCGRRSATAVAAVCRWRPTTTVEARCGGQPTTEAATDSDVDRRRRWPPLGFVRNKDAGSCGFFAGFLSCPWALADHRYWATRVWPLGHMIRRRCFCGAGLPVRIMTRPTCTLR
jgi:hypothetical protein